MFDPRIEALAETVRRNAGANTLPVNLESIAAYDDVILQPIAEHAGFNGKIEFLADENVFVIYHPDPATYPYPTRLRFSIAHELGHYHIDEHRAALVRGETHSSVPNFRSKNPKELQADEFAAALLIPARTMEPRIEKRGFLTLNEIQRIATECGASLHATVNRYVKMTGEACLVCLAQNGSIQSSYPSDEARVRGLGKLAVNRMPQASPAHALSRLPRSTNVQEQKHDSAEWFPNREGLDVWESCVPVGEGYTLSLIAIGTGDADDD